MLADKKSSTFVDDIILDMILFTEMTAQVCNICFHIACSNFVVQKHIKEHLKHA